MTQGMHYSYGPQGRPTTPWGAPLPQHGVGALSTVTSGLNSAVKMALEFGAGYVIGTLAAPTQKEKVAYGVGAGLTTLMFGVVGLGVGALAIQQMTK